MGGERKERLLFALLGLIGLTVLCLAVNRSEADTTERLRACAAAGGAFDGRACMFSRCASTAADAGHDN